jgi:hypothetical protein
VAANPEIEELVRRLEAEQEEESFEPGGPVPSGDAIAQELQRFLKQHGEGPN